MAEAISQTTKQPNKFMRWLASLGNSFVSFFKKIGAFFVGIWNIMRNGNWKTRMSFLIMGFGCFAYAQPLRGVLFLLVEIGFVLFMTFSGGVYLSKFGTLGTYNLYVCCGLSVAAAQRLRQSAKGGIRYAD